MRVMGLISGTSVDGIDGAIATIEGSGYAVTVTVQGGQTVPYPPDLRRQILNVCAGRAVSVEMLAALDDDIAHCFAQVARSLMAQYGSVDLIASHGQTVFHRPVDRKSGRLGYSVQLGRGAAIAHSTQCLTISNFRQADIAAGGEGAPLVPPIDLALLSHPRRWRCIQNVGGIGNVALLPPWDARSDAPLPKVIGWDTGPGNSLLDLAIMHFSDGRQTFDQDGAWAARGTPCVDLVDRWLQHPYFLQLPPKSTGRELFGETFLARCLADAAAIALSPADVLATLTEFTARSIVESYRQFLPRLPDEVLLCGGGSYNQYLTARLQHHLPDVAIATTTAAGVPVGLKEAVAFAVLGYWRYHNFPGNLPAVTGASHAVLLGDVHPALGDMMPLEQD